jgi:hypothetical protein
VSSDMPDEREALRRLHDAVDDCEGHRGAFSCCAQHDVRCPKARSADGSDWKGEWVCACGREELDAAMEEAGTVLADNEGGERG